MRSAIFILAMCVRAAGHASDLTDGSVSILVFIFIAFIAMDVIEFLRKVK